MMQLNAQQIFTRMDQVGSHHLEELDILHPPLAHRLSCRECAAATRVRRPPARRGRGGPVGGGGSAFQGEVVGLSPVTLATSRQQSRTVGHPSNRLSDLDRATGVRRA
jgi:hypothetical protein